VQSKYKSFSSSEEFDMAKNELLTYGNKID
jgi:hypothetical protein